MFKIIPHRTFTREVKVSTPHGLGYREETMRVAFNYLETDEIDAFDLSSTNGTTEFLRAIIVGIEDLEDEREHPVSYTEAVRDGLLKLGSVRQAVLTKYFSVVTGAPEGN